MSLQPEGEYAKICSGDSFEVNCTSLTAVLGWEIIIPGSPSFEPAYFNVVSNIDYVIGDIALTLTSKQPLISLASLSSAGSDHDGTVLICLSTIVASPQFDETANITLIVQGMVYFLILYIQINN